MKRFITSKPLLLGVLLILAALVAGQDALSAGAPVSPTVVYDEFVYLPLIRTTPLEFDMANFIVGDGRLYEVWHSNDSQARHQTQFEGQRFYHTKGIPYAEWEELWLDDNYVYRGTDTSPGSGLYYTLRDGGKYGSKWSPRVWNIGDIYERNPWVTFYYKSNCQVNAEFPQRTWLKFEAYHPEYMFASGITVQEVVVLVWLLSPDGQPAERYFYARDFGLVGWENSHGDYSYVSEVFEDGQRPPNKREPINCLDTGDRPIPAQPDYPAIPFEPPYRAK